MQEISITAGESSKKLENFLKKRFPIGYVRKLFRKNGVRLNGKRSKPDDLIAPGDCVQLYIPFDKDLKSSRQSVTLRDALAIIFEDDEIIVINKPAGIAVHEAKDVLKRDSILGMLEARYRPQGIAPRLVHRLDKDTSGLLVVAKTLRAHSALVRQLQARTVKRDYLAVVHGVVKVHGEVSAPVGRDPRRRTRMAVVPTGRPALTRFKVTKRFARATLLECSLATGRTHQIRVHMQSLGHPLIGDPVYRGKRLDDPRTPQLRRQALHAARLGFSHPVSGALKRFSAPLPEDLRSLLDSLE